MPTTTISINDSTLSPFFNTGEKKILRELSQDVATQIDTTINIVDARVDEVNIRIDNLTLDDLADVVATSPVNKDRLTYNSSTSEWEAASPQTTVVTVAGTTYTLGTVDSYTYIRTTSSSAVTITVPPQSSVSWEDFTQIEIEQGGTGQVTIAAGSGVTINVASLFTAATRVRYSVVGLKRISENVWTLFGDLNLS